ncbi:HAD-IA family hydrolase [candidate division WOR-3 bacterium]|nr:HAD-IA family hydrolase [candidate division WOR-3 bacterium]
MRQGASSAGAGPRLRFRGVLLDLDGTILDSGPGLVRSVHYALQQIGQRDLPDGDDILALVGLPLETILSRLGYRAGPAHEAAFVAAYRAHFARHFREATRTYPYVSEVLGLLKQAGVRLAVVTTKHQTQAEFVTEGCGLAGFFDYIHGYQDGRKHKPDPEPIVTALRRIGVSRRDALMVGDTELDIEAGRAAGTATCAVTYGYRPAALLRQQRPDFMLADVRDLVAVVLMRPR